MNLKNTCFKEPVDETLKVKVNVDTGDLVFENNDSLVYGDTTLNECSWS